MINIHITKKEVFLEWTSFPLSRKSNTNEPCSIFIEIPYCIKLHYSTRFNRSIRVKGELLDIQRSLGISGLNSIKYSWTYLFIAWLFREFYLINCIVSSKRMIWKTYFPSFKLKAIALLFVFVSLCFYKKISQTVWLKQKFIFLH